MVDEAYRNVQRYFVVVIVMSVLFRALRSL
jgi:hypothetical protein